MPQLTTEIISAAIDGLEEKRRKLDEQIAELRGMLSGKPTNSESTATSESTPGKRKKFSAASRRKMALAQKARWAKIKGETETPEAVAPAKKKRKMSAAGRKAISEATKKRWAAVRAVKEKASKKAASKKDAKRKAAVKKSAPVALASAQVA
jgi:hypothetical protein